MSYIATVKEKQHKISELSNKIIKTEEWLYANFDKLHENDKLIALKRYEKFCDDFLILTGIYHHQYLNKDTTTTETIDSSHPNGILIDKYGKKQTSILEFLNI